METVFLSWVTLQQLPLLENLEKETRELLEKKAKDLNITLKTVVILKGLILLSLINKSNKPIGVIAQGLKGYTSRFLRENHKELMRYESLWETGYYSE